MGMKKVEEIPTFESIRAQNAGYNRKALSGEGAQAHWDGKTRSKGGVGGGWDEVGEVKLQTSSSANRISSHSNYSDSSPVVRHVNAPAPHAPPPTGDGEFEQRLITNLTLGAGVRQTVARQDLQKFVATCRSLNLGLVAELLEQHLADAENHVVQSVR